VYYSCLNLMTGRASVPFGDRTFKNSRSIEYTVPAECHHWHSICQPCQLWHQQVSTFYVLLRFFDWVVHWVWKSSPIRWCWERVS